MDHGKALKIALVRSGETQVSLAENFKVDRQQVTRWVASKAFTHSVMVRILEHFDMKESDFVALSE